RRLQHRDVGGRVAVDYHEIGEASRGELTELEADQWSHVTRRSQNRRRRRHAHELNVALQFCRIRAVMSPWMAEVSTGYDLDACCRHPLQAFDLRDELARIPGCFDLLGRDPP